MNAFESSDARSERFGVGKIRYLGRRLRAAIAACMLSSMPLLTGGCATDSYAGVPLTAGAADAELQALAMRAQGGDKQAQLELGIRYEEGRGVPRDLERARSLYFEAATRPSRQRVAAYIPTPGGIVSSHVRTFPAGREYSGLEEALLRWHRLMASSEIDGGDTPSDAPLPSSADSGTYSGLPEDRREAEQLLADFHGFQPIFNGLKAREGRWEARIAAEPGTRFLTPLSLADSFSSILDPARARPGDAVPADRIATLCRAELAPRTGYGTGQRRLAGLCALSQCTLVNHERWEALAESLETALGRDSAETAAAAQDAAFLARVSALCDERDISGRLFTLTARFIRQVADARQACERRGCSQEEAAAIDRRRIAVDMHLLIAVAESDAVPPDLAAQAARDWTGSRLPAPPPAGNVDTDIAELCSRAAVPPGDCRQRFPHSFFLEQRYLDTVARALSGSGARVPVCNVLNAFSAAHRAEINYRFAGASPAQSLRFAARCNPSGTNNHG